MTDGLETSNDDDAVAAAGISDKSDKPKVYNGFTKYLATQLAEKVGVSKSLNVLIHKPSPS